MEYQVLITPAPTPTLEHKHKNNYFGVFYLPTRSAERLRLSQRKHSSSPQLMRKPL